MRTYRFILKGRVQGVFFRASTRDVVENEKLAVCGFVRNISDGSVEVLAQGNEIAIEFLKRWLSKGPKFARVDSVTVEEFDDQMQFKDFVVK